MKWIQDIRDQLNQTQTKQQDTTTKARVKKTLKNGDKVMQDINTEENYLLPFAEHVKYIEKEHTPISRPLYKEDVVQVETTGEKTVDNQTYKTVKIKALIKRFNTKTTILQDLKQLMEFSDAEMASRDDNAPLNFSKKGVKKLIDYITYTNYYLNEVINKDEQG